MTETCSAFFRGKKVLITGGLGFIGVNLCLRLMDLAAEVTVMDHFVPPDFSFMHPHLRPGFSLITGDIRDKNKVKQAVLGKDVIFNLAGRSGAADSNKKPQADLDTNCHGHMTLLETCRAINPRVTIVFPSSRLVYGKPKFLPVDESHHVQPESIYAADKLAGENYHLVFGKLCGMKVTVLRISNPYGPMHMPRIHNYGIANRFIQAAVAGETVILFGNGEQCRDFLYVGDLVDALLRSAWSEQARGKTYNIGSRRGVSLLELAKMVVAAAGKGEIVQVPWPEDCRAIETGDYCSEIALAQRELGWMPVTDIHTGIAASVAFYQRQIKGCHVLGGSNEIAAALDPR